ncbi:septum site-determining protein MinC [Thiomicrorhabdus indica]|uniref:septum site-determining protein MinC n=1 Tax=Thiomicrorhabdus indica TaxID=2267253 RepID=UPI002AA7A61B|nr:septum site-determining protein MinC [Thiomicrorhabdus indica]
MSQKIIELKGSILTLSVLKFFSDDFAQTQQALREKVDQAPSFFVGIPVVLEPQVELQDPTFLALMVEFLHQLQMIPIGVRTKDETIINQAQYAGLAVFPPEEKRAKAKKEDRQPESLPAGDKVVDIEMQAVGHSEVESQNSEVASAEVVEAITPPEQVVQSAMVINRSIRSGQQIHAPNQDVVITGSVNPGAEVIADGNITVFGKVLGKVIAGASGNMQAKVFATELNPEIVCIAGVYQLSDDIDEKYKKGLVQVELRQEKLVLSPLTK